MHHVHTCEQRYTNSPGALGVPRLPGAPDPTDEFSEILNHCANMTDFWCSQETSRVGNAQLPNCPIVQLSNCPCLTLDSEAGGGRLHWAAYPPGWLYIVNQNCG